MDNDRINNSIRDESGRFVKGYKHSDLPLDFKEKIRQSMSNSWKDREDYIADLVNECPYIYNSWRGIMFSEKGKKAGVCERWRTFKNFYSDVRPTYQKGLVFRRRDYHRPFDVDNFIWCTKEEASSMQPNIVCLEYNGEILTLKQLADKYNQSYYALRIRYFQRETRGYTLDEIVLGRKKKRGSKLSKDYRDDGVKIREKASKMISSYKCKDYKNGTDICDIDIDWMIDNILTKKCIYCGDNKRIGCDRIDNKLGHTKNNVVPCCIECNTARNNLFSFEEMKVLGKTIREIKQNRANG